MAVYTLVRLLKLIPASNPKPTPLAPADTPPFAAASSGRRSPLSFTAPRLARPRRWKASELGLQREAHAKRVNLIYAAISPGFLLNHRPQLLLLLLSL